MFNKNFFFYLYGAALFIGLLIFGQPLIPGVLAQDFKTYQSIFWQVISAAVLGFVLANSGYLKKRRKFKIPHIRF